MFSKPSKQVAVVVPVYKSVMTTSEELSFERCLSVLGNYQIVLMAPEGVDLRNYTDGRPGMGISIFEPRHFETVRGYDRLMLSKSFYQRFLDFEYILVHQLDAFVFSDRLKEWCAKGYDYIGAPWIDFPAIESIASSCTQVRQLFPRRIKKRNSLVGNGGFSLRRVRAFWRFLSVWKTKAHTWPYHEDSFWAFFATDYPPFLRVPKFEEALKFAFELNPSKCYALNNHELPFGCHAWEKHDVQFWKPIFRDLGYTI